MAALASLFVSIKADDRDVTSSVARVRASLTSLDRQKVQPKVSLPDTLTRDIAGFQSKLQALGRQQVKLNVDSSVVKAEVSTLTRQLDTLTRQRRSIPVELRGDIDRQIKSVQSDLAAVARKETKIPLQLERVDAKIAAVKTSLGALERNAVDIPVDIDKRGTLKGKLASIKASIGGLGGSMIAAFGAVGVGRAISDTVTKAGNFEAAMKLVGKTTGATGAQLKDMSALALKMGKETTFSAQGAADAMLELAKGGLTQAQIKAGALQATLTLAAAGGLQLGDASTYVVQGLTTFGLTADKASTVAAALAGGANASTASVESMGQALSQVGPGAKIAGLSIQETTAALAAFDNAGIKGSDAGTSLKTMLTRLVPSTNAARNEMNRLGLDFTNADGSFKSLTEISGELQNGLKGLTAEQKTTALATIFGADATRAASVLAENGAAGLAKLIKATSNQGAAQDLAKTKTEGFKGALEAFKGSVETLQIQLGTKLLPVLTKVLNWLATDGYDAAVKIGSAFAVLGPAVGMVGSVLGKVFGVMSGHATTMKVLAGAIGLVVAAMAAQNATMAVAAAGGLAKYIASTRIVTTLTKAWAAVQWALNAAMRANPIGIVVTALAALAAGAIYAYKHFEPFRKVVDAVAGALRTGLLAALTVAKSAVAAVASSVAAAWGSVKTVTASVFGSISDVIAKSVKAWGSVIRTSISALGGVVSAGWAVLRTVTATVFGAISAVISAAVKAWASVIRAEIAGIGAVVRAAWAVLSAITRTAFEAIRAVITTVWNTIKTLFTSSMAVVRAGWTAFWNVLRTTATTVFTAIRTVITTIWTAVRTLFTTAMAAVRAAWTVWWTALRTIATTTFTAIRTTITTIWNAVRALFTSMMAAVRAAWSVFWIALRTTATTLFTAIRTTISSVWTSIRGVWTTAQTAVRSAWSAFWTSVRTTASSAMSGVQTLISAALGRITSAFGTAKTNIGRVWDGVKSVVSAPINWIRTNVYNNVLVPVWNRVAGLVGGTKLSAFADGGIVGEFARGGIAGGYVRRGIADAERFANGGIRDPGPAHGARPVAGVRGPHGIRPGYTPGRDTHIIAVGGGEAIMRPEWTRAAGADYVHGANRAARQGGVAGAKAFIEKMGMPRYAAGGTTGGTTANVGRFGVPGFALGGLIGAGARALSSAASAITGAASKIKGFVLGGLKAAASAAFAPIRALINSQLSGTPVKDTVGKIANKAIDLVLAKIDSSDALAGGSFGASGASPNGVGGLGPRAAAARAYVIRTFGITNIGGYSYRNIAGTNTLSDHARGKAIDVMTRNIPLGNRVASAFITGAKTFGTKYVIWQQQINSGSGWRKMADRGSDTQNHRDHVHISFYNKGGVAGGVPGLADGGLVQGGRGGITARIGEGRHDELVTPLPRGWNLGKGSGSDAVDRLVALIESGQLGVNHFDFTTYNPVAEPQSVTTNKALQRISALGLVG